MLSVRCAGPDELLNVNFLSKFSLHQILILLCRPYNFLHRPQNLYHSQVLCMHNCISTQPCSFNFAAPRRDRRLRETTCSIPVCFCSYRVRRLLVLCVRPTSPSGKRSALRSKTVWAKLRCSRPLRRTDSTFSVAARWLQGLLVGLCCLALQRNEARALREHGQLL